jgi:regulator of replication initiation timing
MEERKLVTILESLASHIEDLETKIYILKHENESLRKDNERLKEENEGLRAAVEIGKLYITQNEAEKSKLCTGLNEEAEDG